VKPNDKEKIWMLIKRPFEKVSPLALVVVLMFLVPSLMSAQDNSLSQPDTPLPWSRQAKTIPISDKRISLRLTFPEGQTMVATQLEGGMIRIEKDKAIFGLTPYITDHDNGTIAEERCCCRGRHCRDRDSGG
jgi:hypothetical protein